MIKEGVAVTNNGHYNSEATGKRGNERREIKERKGSRCILLIRRKRKRGLIWRKGPFKKQE